MVMGSQFIFGTVKFEVTLRHASEDIEQRIGCQQCRGEDQAGNINEKHLKSVVYKTMGQMESTGGCVWREKSSVQGADTWIPPSLCH